MRLIWSAVLGVCSAAIVAGAAENAGPALTPLRSDLYHDGWIDFNKNGKKDVFEDPTQPLEKRLDDLLSQMSVDEKTCQLATLYGYQRVLKDPLPTPEWKSEIWKDGIANIDEMHNGIAKGGKIAVDDPLGWPASAHARGINEVQKWFVEETRLGIPVDFTNEGIRGLNSLRTTNFPAQVGVGATWDRELVSEIGTITGHEGKVLGYTNVYSPILDLARDPRWGRVVESYGEDPYLVAELGVQQILAIQKQGVASTGKHFAVYSIPKGGRDGAVRTDPEVAPREMENLYLYPWKRAVEEAGILGAMVSYNDYDGVPMAGNHEFLIDRLRTEWGFRGYVVSDSGAVENLLKKHRVAPTLDDAVAMFLNEGGNVCTDFKPPADFILPVRKMVAAGKISMATLDSRVRDVLRVKFLVGLFDHPYVEDPAAADAVVHSAASAKVALRAAQESIVLLKNEKKTLPLSKGLKKILVCGPTAKMTETSLDRYGSNGGKVVTLLEGISAAVGGGTTVDFAQGCDLTDARWPESEIYPEAPAGKDADMIAEAVAKAADADAIVVALGDSMKTIGEAKSRTSLDLPGYQTDLVQALMKTGKPVIVVMLGGRAATINWIDRYAPAVVEAWFPGEAGGTAIADVLFGDYNPGGKLPVTFPRTVGQVPFNFPYKPSSQVPQSNKVNPNGWGNSLIEGVIYPFGYGLSYTSFRYSDLDVSPKTLKADGNVTIALNVTNTGDRAGDEIVQLYLQDAFSSVTTYDLNLRGFERVSLQPGETKKVTFSVPAKSMELINREGKHVVEPGDFKVMIGASSADIRLTGSYTVTE
jgi:beta-glucosidase